MRKRNTQMEELSQDPGGARRRKDFNMTQRITGLRLIRQDMVEPDAAQIMGVGQNASEAVFQESTRITAGSGKQVKARAGDYNHG